MTRRLLFSYLSVTVFVLLLLELPLAIFFQQRELDRLTADAERDATVLASIYHDALQAGSQPDPVPAADYALATGARVVVVDTRGISVIDTNSEGPRDFSTRPEFEVALTGRHSVGTRRSETLRADLLFVAVPVASGGRVFGALRLTLDTREVTEQVRRFWVGLAAVAAVVLATVAAIGWAIARWVTHPIRHLRATADRFSDGDLTQTEPDASSPPELIALEEAMNTMARRLDRLITQQKEFVADASHQLRTPLTGLRLRLENLQSETAEPRQVDALERAIEETNRLATLVEDLLQLARAEKQAKPEPFELVGLTVDRIDTWTAIAELSEVTLELSVPDSDVWVMSVPGAIEQILDNVIDNAISASPPGSTITVSVEPNTRSARLSIADTGPGLDQTQRGQALDRFWRAGAGGNGTGLGLAIVNTLVEASHASISLGNNMPSGLVVAVTFDGAPTQENPIT